MQRYRSKGRAKWGPRRFDGLGEWLIQALGSMALAGVQPA